MAGGLPLQKVRIPVSYGNPFSFFTSARSLRHTDKEVQAPSGKRIILLGILSFKVWVLGIWWSVMEGGLKLGPTSAAFAFAFAFSCCLQLRRAPAVAKLSLFPMNGFCRMRAKQTDVMISQF